MAYIDIEGPQFDTRVLIGEHGRSTPGWILPPNCKILFIEYSVNDFESSRGMLIGDLKSRSGIDQHASLRSRGLKIGTIIAAAEPILKSGGYIKMRYARAKTEILDPEGDGRLIRKLSQVAVTDKEMIYGDEEYNLVVSAARKYDESSPENFISVRNCLIAERVNRFTSWWLRTQGKDINPKPAIAISTGLFHLEVARDIQLSPEERLSYLESQAQALNQLVSRREATKVLYGILKTSPNYSPYMSCKEVDLSREDPPYQVGSTGWNWKELLTKAFMPKLGMNIST